MKHVHLMDMFVTGLVHFVLKVNGICPSKLHLSWKHSETEISEKTRTQGICEVKSHHNSPVFCRCKPCNNQREAQHGSTLSLHNRDTTA